MKLVESNPSNKTKVVSKKSFKVGIAEENAHLIKRILRSDIYSDKIAAPVREYLTNARDEHVKYNIDKPIEVLVDRDKLTWSVRDFAKGLPSNTIEMVYFNYGSSDKNDSDIGAGGFGVGSKAGHAYGDKFFVTSYYDGIKTVYAGIIKTDPETGIEDAEVHVMYEGKTEEPTGIKVEVPIKTLSDFNVFLDKSYYFAKYLDVPCLVNGKEVKKEKPVFSGDNWELHESNGYSSRANKVIVGPVPYDLPRHLTNLPMDIYMDIKDVKIAVSREQVQLTPKTEKNIREVISKAEKEVEDLVEKKISAAHLYWDKLDLVNKLSGSLRTMGYKLLPNKPTFKKRRENGRLKSAGYWRTGFDITQESIIYHIFLDENTNAPKGCWKMDEHVDHCVYTQEWATQKEFEDAKKDKASYWHYAPNNHLGLLKDVVVPKSVLSQQKQYSKKEFHEDLGLFRWISNRKTQWSNKFMLDRNLSEDDAERIFKQGGYYLECARGQCEEAIDKLQNKYPDISVRETIANNEKFVGSVKRSIKHFKKNKNWKTIDEYLAGISSLDLFLEKRKCWATYLLGLSANLPSSDKYSVSVNSINLVDMISDDLVGKLKEYSVYKKTDVFTLSSNLHRFLNIKAQQSTEKRYTNLLTTKKDIIYSIAGAKIFNDKQEEQKLLKKLKEQ